LRARRGRTNDVPASVHFQPGVARADHRLDEQSESYNKFSKYFFFGGEGVIADNDPVEQEKAVKYNDLGGNAVIFHNVVEQTRIIKTLIRQG